VLVAFLYIYERGQRGLREYALVGTWVHQPANSESLYYDSPWKSLGTGNR